MDEAQYNLPNLSKSCHENEMGPCNKLFNTPFLNATDHSLSLFVSVGKTKMAASDDAACSIAWQVSAASGVDRLRL